MGNQQNPNIREFSDYLRYRRSALGLSLNQLESLTGIHNSRLSRWERGIEMPNRADRLVALAQGLDVPIWDLYEVAGIEIPQELPSHRVYLRSKYGADLPPGALAEIAEHADQVAARYGVNTGPAPGEDEEALPKGKAG